MANINWDSQELESTAAQVNTLLQNYDKTMDEIQQTLNTMEFRLKLRTDVDNDLSKLKRRVSQERSKMQQVRQTVNLAASKTTDLNGKLIGYTNDIGDLSVKSNASNISAGNSVNFLQWTALGSLGISGMVDVISGFVSKIGSWLLGKKSGQTDTSTTPSIDYSGKEHPNTVSSSDVSNTTSNASSTTQNTYGLTESTGSSRGKINCVWLARGQVCEIIGEDIYANRSILHNGADINWKHYADTGETINGHSISYYDASSKLTDAVKTLADSEPCSAMFYFPGHTMTIQRVENGKVYFTDNWTKGSANTEISTCTSLWKGNNSHPTTGSTLSLSIEEFANTYQKYNPKLNKMVIIK